MKYSIYRLMAILLITGAVSCKKTGADSGMQVNATAPSVTTADASNITGTNATVGGNIPTDNGSIVMEAGIVYSTTSGVDTTKTRVPVYTNGGSFSVPLKNLSLLTRYYYRAYAINAKGITYGAEKSFFMPVNGYTASSQVATASLVGYWAFDGSLIDSVSGQTATSTNTTFAAAGVKKQALQTGANGYALFTPGAALTGMSSFSIAYWVNAPVNSNGIAGTVNLSNNTNFWGNIDQFFENGSTANGAIFKLHVTNGNGKDHWLTKTGLPGIFNTWTNIVTTFDGPANTFKLYVNGAEVASEVDASLGNLQFANSGKLVFGTVQFMTNPSLTTGSGAQPWAGFLNGQMDEVRIYNKALTAAEILALYALQGKGY